MAYEDPLKAEPRFDNILMLPNSKSSFFWGRASLLRVMKEGRLCNKNDGSNGRGRKFSETGPKGQLINCLWPAPE